MGVVADLLERGMPVDGVGHQFHLGRGQTIDGIHAALDAVADCATGEATSPNSTSPRTTTRAPATKPGPVAKGNSPMSRFPDSWLGRRSSTGPCSTQRGIVQNVRAVLTWGLHDGQSWLNNFPVPQRANHPLLFGRNLAPKPALRALLDVGAPAPLLGDGLVPSRIPCRCVANPGDRKGRPYGAERLCSVRGPRRGRACPVPDPTPVRRESGRPQGSPLRRGTTEAGVKPVGDGVVPFQIPRRCVANPGDRKGRPYGAERLCSVRGPVGDGLVPSRIPRPVRRESGDRKGRPYGAERPGLVRSQEAGIFVTRNRDKGRQDSLSRCPQRDPMANGLVARNG